jgi:hypothetical protein
VFSLALAAISYAVHIVTGHDVSLRFLARQAGSLRRPRLILPR